MVLTLLLIAGFFALSLWLLTRAPRDLAKRPAVKRPPGKVRPLSSEELAGVAANLYSARGFTLVRQEVQRDAAELLLESPSRKPLVVRCIPAKPQPLDGAELQNVVLRRGTANFLRETVLLMPGRFSEDARGVAERQRLELVDGENLLQLLRRYLPGAAEALRLVPR